MHFKKEIRKKKPQMKKKKVLHHQDNAPYHKSIAMLAKLHELNLELLLHWHYSPDLAPSNNWLFADLKRMLQGKRFGPNKEVISETEAYYFKAKDKLFYKKRHQIDLENLFLKPQTWAPHFQFQQVHKPG